jgi:hypothetical protein
MASHRVQLRHRHPPGHRMHGLSSHRSQNGLYWLSMFSHVSLICGSL